MAPDDAASGSRYYRRVVTVAIAALLAYLLFRIVQPFLAPIAWALILAFALAPLQPRLTARLRGRESAAAFLLTMLTLVLFVGPLTVLGAAFAAQARALIETLQRGAARLQIENVGDIAELPVLQRALAWVESHVAVSGEQLREWVSAGAQRVLEPLASMGGQLVLGAVGTIASFTVMLFMLFFFVRDGRRMTGAALRLIPLDAAHKVRLTIHMREVTRAVLFGTVATAVLQGFLVGVGFALAGFDSSVVFGVLAAVLSVVPFGGTALVWAPAAVWLFVEDRLGAAIFLAVWGTAIVGLADNVVRPMLISGRSEVPTLAVFVGVLGGLAAFGLVGLFVGPLVIALAIALLRFADEVVGGGPGADPGAGAAP